MKKNEDYYDLKVHKRAKRLGKFKAWKKVRKELDSRKRY